MYKPVRLVHSGWQSDLELVSDGYGEFPDGYHLTEKGAQKVLAHFELLKYVYAEFCDCENPVEGDGTHVAGEPSDLICLNTPLIPERV